MAFDAEAAVRGARHVRAGQARQRRRGEPRAREPLGARREPARALITRAGRRSAARRAPAAHGNLGASPKRRPPPRAECAPPPARRLSPPLRPRRAPRSQSRLAENRCATAAMECTRSIAGARRARGAAWPHENAAACGGTREPTCSRRQRRARAGARLDRGTHARGRELASTMPPPPRQTSEGVGDPAAMPNAADAPAGVGSSRGACLVVREAQRHRGRQLEQCSTRKRRRDAARCGTSRPLRSTPRDRAQARRGARAARARLRLRARARSPCMPS